MTFQNIGRTSCYRGMRHPSISETFGKDGGAYGGFVASHFKLTHDQASHLIWVTGTTWSDR
jgi:hypothetical protein